MANYESLLADATQLPVADRIQLIEALWETVPEELLHPLYDEWSAETDSRSAEHSLELPEPMTWEVIWADALRRLDRTSD